jgi:hypothetical protein
MTSSRVSPAHYLALALSALSRGPRWVLAVLVVVLFTAWSGAAYMA